MIRGALLLWSVCCAAGIELLPSSAAADPLAVPGSLQAVPLPPIELSPLDHQRPAAVAKTAAAPSIDQAPTATVKRLDVKLLKAQPASTRQRSSWRQPLRLVGDQRVGAGEEDRLVVPIATIPPDPDVDFQGKDGKVKLVATGADLKSVLRMIAAEHQLNLVVGPDIKGDVTVSIRDARFEEVLDAILGVAGYSWHRSDNLLYITDSTATGMDPRVQGRELRVYPLNYVAASDVQSVATSLLSPIGTAHISESDSANELKTREVLIVEDVSAGHQRIEQYIAQIDIPPKQVLIEAHVLQIALDDEEKHGIDLKALTRVDGSSITLEGSGFTEDNTDAILALRVDGGDLDSVIQLIRQNTNSRTLASPKLSVVNHQEAKIQIGQRLPYSVSTTTQTTTVQTVEFLEVGIVLTVRPVITADGNVLMYVLPKVSGGTITQNGFPEEETTEVQTTIMIPDGGGIVIGGLIREGDVQTRASVPYLSKVPIMGRLFQRRTDEVRRNELVVALVAHVIEPGCPPRAQEAIEMEAALPDYAASEQQLHSEPVIYYE